jgi:hypothetical protein
VRIAARLRKSPNTALLSTAWAARLMAARLIGAGRAAQSGRGRQMCARPCCV